MNTKLWLLGCAVLASTSFSWAGTLVPDAKVLPKLAREWQTAPGQFPPGRIKFTKDYRIISTPAFSDVEPQSGFFHFLSENMLRVTPDIKDQPASDMTYVLVKNELRLTYASGESQLFIPAKPVPASTKTKVRNPVKP